MVRSAGVLLVFVASLAFGGVAEKDKAANLQKTGTNDLYRPFLINNVFNYYSNNGDGSYNKFSTDNEGFEFYKGGGKHIMFEDGVVWGGFHKGRTDPKVGGSVYRHGLQAGPILTPGTATTVPVAADAANPRFRIFRVRPDIRPEEFIGRDGKTVSGTPFADVEGKLTIEEVSMINRFESTTARELYDQYVKDWNEWPADLGAPFTYGMKDDTTQRTAADGPYDPKYDIPGQPGSSQTLWYVSNDMSEARVSNLSGSPPIGLEMHRTIWGYKRGGALGSTIFMSSILINKSGAPIDSMYLVQWADPDLGDAGDDFAGCDTTRSLGYIYNSDVDATYGTGVPAGGFDFFQGPLVAAAPTDSGLFKLQWRKGFKNLPMTAFVFFTQGNEAFRDPVQGGGGDIQWYRLMNGLTAPAGAPFIDPTTQKATKFTLAGDPVTGTGWVDGMGGITANDRRICMVTGPFRMAVGDTQELVVAALAGLGGDRLSSITVMKSVDDKAQEAYNGLFVLPDPPPAPNVTATAMNGEVILSWGDQQTIETTEGTVSQGFVFEGYNVWEFPNPASDKPILLGKFDLNNSIKTISDTLFDPVSGLDVPTVIQQGTDNGVVRSMRITASKVTGRPLVNGTKYYFSVSAFSYNPDPPAAAGTHSLESPTQVFTVIPESPRPGTRYAATPGDTLQAALTTAPGAPASNGAVIPIVVDPTKTTGHQYKVSFDTDPATGGSIWKLTDVTLSKDVLTGQTNQTGDGNYVIVDGLMVKVTGPAPGINTYGIRGTRRWTWADGVGFGLEHFGNTDSTDHGIDASIGTIGNAYQGWFSSGVGPDRMRKVEIRLAAGDSTWSLTQPTDPNVSKAYRYLRSATAAAARPEFAPFIINKTSGYAFQDYNYSVPFAAYDMDATPPRRLAVGHLENNQPGGRVDGKWWPALGATVGGDANVASGGPREWWFIFDAPYTETADAALATDILNNTVDMMYMGTNTRRSGGNPVAGDAVVLTPARVNTAAHTFSFTAPAVTAGDQALAKADVGKINVFPNPYLGFNPLEENRYARFVTFNHLPAKATIRVFNLAGVLVRTIQKNDPTQYIQWDLNNETGFPVSAGMYVVYIDMPEVGTTKTLKLGIVPEQQYLDRW